MATDIDVPFLPSAAQIRRREFASVRRGYDPDQVRDYLSQVAEQVEMLEQEVRETKLQPAPGLAGRTAPAETASTAFEKSAEWVGSTVGGAVRRIKKAMPRTSAADRSRKKKR